MATKKAIVRRGNGPHYPLENFERLKHYVHYDLEKKPTADIVKSWIKENFKKQEVPAILANPDYHFAMYSYMAASIIWLRAGKELPEKWSHIPEHMKEYFTNLIENGKKLLKKAEQKAIENAGVVILTPQQRLFQKVQQTIMVELDELEDQWIAGEKTEFDLYNRFRFHTLPTQAVEIVRRRIQAWHSEYYDAYNKKCDQAVEAYSHIQRSEQKRRIKVCDSMLADLDKLKAASVAQRKPRTPKTKAADKQVAKLKFLKADSTYKLDSISPMQIVGAFRLYTFNVKTRVVSEYITNSTKGFEVQGTSIKNFDPDQSRQTRLRKPEDFLPIIQGKTPKQIDNAFKSLSTKISAPNGRLNEDTILVRAMDR